eukprot:4633706-Amphidinium_carterae.1
MSLRGLSGAPAQACKVLSTCQQSKASINWRGRNCYFLMGSKKGGMISYATMQNMLMPLSC